MESSEAHWEYGSGKSVLRDIMAAQIYTQGLAEAPRVVLGDPLMLRVALGAALGNALTLRQPCSVWVYERQDRWESYGTKGRMRGLCAEVREE